MIHSFVTARGCRTPAHAQPFRGYTPSVISLQQGIGERLTSIHLASSTSSCEDAPVSPILAPGSRSRAPSLRSAGMQQLDHCVCLRLSCGLYYCRASSALRLGFQAEGDVPSIPSPCIHSLVLDDSGYRAKPWIAKVNQAPEQCMDSRAITSPSRWPFGPFFGLPSASARLARCLTRTLSSCSPPCNAGDSSPSLALNLGGS